MNLKGKGETILQQSGKQEPCQDFFFFLFLTKHLFYRASAPLNTASFLTPSPEQAPLHCRAGATLPWSSGCVSRKGEASPEHLWQHGFEIFGRK